MRIKAFAKVNLTLEVLGVRSDGYHALRSVVAPLSLADELELVEASEITSDSGFADDLIVKAARALGAANQLSRGVAVKVTKRIPPGGGLGGGSADAAAVLVALNALWALGLSRRELAEIGALVGSDVPALTLAQPPLAGETQGGGAVLMEGRGERVQFLREAALARGFSSGWLAEKKKEFAAVLVNPGVFSSTPAVFARCEVLREATGGEECLRRFLAACSAASLVDFQSTLQNDLQAAALGLHPEIGAALSRLTRLGLAPALMSGSGSSVFALAPSLAVAEQVALQVRAQGMAAWAVQLGL